MNCRYVSTWLDDHQIEEAAYHSGRISRYSYERRAYQDAAHLRIAAHDRSEVDQYEAPIVVDEKIPRMRIGVKQSVHEHHLYVRLDNRLDDSLSAQRSLGDPRRK